MIVNSSSVWEDDISAHDHRMTLQGAEDVLNQPDTISLEDIEYVEHPRPHNQRDRETLSGVDERTPVDNFIRDNGRKYYVT